MPNPTLLVIPCPVKINCPGTDSPFANLTMEAPDSEIFIGQNFGFPGVVPPLGWSYRNPRGFNFCGSITSQLLADLCAGRGAFDDQVDQPPGDPDGGDWRTPDGATPPIFESNTQQCNALCNDGTVFTFRLPPGAFHNLVQADADAAALSEACRIANEIKICFLGTFTETACIGDPYSSFVGITGLGTFTFEIISGALPPGLTLSQAGSSPTQQNGLLLLGTPLISGAYAFTIRVVGAAGDQIKTFTVTVWGFDFATPPPVYSVGIAYSYQFAGIGGTPPYTFTPATASDQSVLDAVGLTLTTAGLLSGTPTQSGSITFSIKITDSTP